MDNPDYIAVVSASKLKHLRLLFVFKKKVITLCVVAGTYSTGFFLKKKNVRIKKRIIENSNFQIVKQQMGNC